MTSTPSPIARHHETAKQHLAAVAAARDWINDLMAAHLLDSQSPIKDEPIGGPAEVKP